MVASKKGRHTATVHLKEKKKSKDVGDEVEYRGEWRMDWSLEKERGKKYHIRPDCSTKPPLTTLR